MNVSMIKRIEQRLDNWLDTHIFWGAFSLCTLSGSGVILGLFFLQEIFGIPFYLLITSLVVFICSVVGVKSLWWVIHDHKRIWNHRQLLWDHRRLILMCILNLVPYYLATWLFVTFSDEITHFWLRVLLLPHAMVLAIVVLCWPLIFYTWPRFLVAFRQRDTLEFIAGGYLGLMVFLFLLETFRPFLQ